MTENETTDNCCQRTIPALKWSYDPPRSTGWYWYYSDTSKMPTIFYVSRGVIGMYAIQQSTGGFRDVSRMAGRWAGPIDEPI